MLVYSNFSIFEDLYSNCLSATVTIVDSNSIFTEFPIIGDEFIEIMFRSLNTEISIHLKFRVVRVSELEQINETTNVYTLLLSSPVSILSEKQKISKSFAGINHKTHYIVKNICEKCSVVSFLATKRWFLPTFIHLINKFWRNIGSKGLF